MAALGYTRLDRSKKTIRLLTVAPGEPEERIRCELTHADLDEQPSFIALSYAWDQGGGYDEIECCGTTTQVGKNLRNFLHRFRIWDEGRGNQLWIDALCINQNDVPERNHQVGQMRNLYSTATSAIAWLGEMSSNSDLVYSAMFAPRDCVGNGDDGTRQELVVLLNRPYWSRFWVIQEFLLPMNLNLWWNGYRVKVQDLCSVVRTITGNRLRGGSLSPFIWNTTASELLRYREIYQGKGLRRYFQEMPDYFHPTRSRELRETLRLRSLLNSFSRSQCTLKHDGVYALLGITSDVTNPSHPILPDYNKPLEDLLLDVVRNQYGTKVPEAGYAWAFVHQLCDLFRLNRQEMEDAFIRAPKVERERHALDPKNQIAMSYDWHGTVSLQTPNLGSPRKLLEGTIKAMGREPGCLAALQNHIDYYTFPVSDWESAQRRHTNPWHSFDSTPDRHVWLRDGTVQLSDKEAT